jgi:hypothetical protein
MISRNPGGRIMPKQTPLAPWRCPLSIRLNFAGPRLRGDKPFPGTAKTPPGTPHMNATFTHKRSSNRKSSAQRRCKVALKTNSVSFGQIEAQLRHKASSPQFQMPAADERSCRLLSSACVFRAKMSRSRQRRPVATLIFQIAPFKRQPLSWAGIKQAADPLFSIQGRKS